MLGWYLLMRDALAYTLNFVIAHWKPFSVLTLVLLSIWWVHELKTENATLQRKLKVSQEEHSKYVNDQKVVTQKRDLEVDTLQVQLNDYAKGASLEIIQKDKILDGLNATNRVLVGRLSEQSKSTIIRHQQVPNTNPTILKEYQSTSESLTECAERYSDMARQADSLSVDLITLKGAVDNFNAEVEVLNKQGENSQATNPLKSATYPTHTPLQGE